MLQNSGVITEEYAVREATDGDVPAILDLVKRSLGEGRTPRTETFWRWKHAENPFGPSACLVAESRDGIIGLRVFMRWQWQSAGHERIAAVRAVDTATDVKWRGRGIFSRLTMDLLRQMQQQGVAVVYNTPNQYSLRGNLKLGWTYLGRPSVWIRPIRPMRLLAHALKKAPWTAHDFGLETQSGVDASLAALHQTRELSSFLDEANRSESRWSTPLSVEYLAWRYGRIPGFAYRAIWQLSPDAGFLALYRHKTHTALLELRIAELIVGDGRSSSRARRLINEMIRSSRCDVATARARGPRARAVLAATGFVPVPGVGPIFTIRPLGEERGTDRLHDWALSIGDIEIF